MPELNGPVYASFLILGAANLVPWMTFLSLADYFAFRYGNNAMEFTFPAISTSVLVAVSALLLAVGSAFSFDVRIVPPTLAMALMMLTVPAIDVLVVSGSLTTEVAFPLTLLTVFVSALSSAVAQNSLYGLGGLLGEGVMQALQAGNGVAGVLSVALRAASKLGLPVALSMWVFCGAAALLVVLSVFGYRRVMVDPQIASAVYAARNYAAQFAARSPGAPFGTQFVPQFSDSPLSTLPSRRYAHELKRVGRHASAKNPSALAQLLEDNGMMSGSMPTQPSPGGTDPMASPVDAFGMSEKLSSAWLVGRESVSVFVVFLVCLSCFPGLTTSLHSHSWDLGDWFPLLLVATYNTGDLVGKWLPAPRLPLIGRYLPARVRLFGRGMLPVVVLLHLCFIPAFLLMVSKPPQLASLLKSDAVPLTIVLLLGVSTGYIGCMCLSLAAERGTTAAQKEMAGMVSSFALMVGLSAGSALGLALSNFIAPNAAPSLPPPPIT